MRTYGFSLPKNSPSPTIEAMDEQLLHDVQRYADKTLSQTAGLSQTAMQKLENKGWTRQAIEEAWRKLQPSQKRSSKHKTETRWAFRLFRFGFAGVFLINALVAYLQPQDFLGLMQKSLALNWLGSLEWLIPVIAINDLALAVVILAAPKRYRPYVFAWTGLWFLAITIVKLTALNVFTS